MSSEVAVIETTLGNIELEFLEDVAPGHTKNFKDLANKGFYDGTIFHRVIPGFMIQGGDPNSKSEDRAAHGLAGRYVLEFEQMLWVELTPNGAAPAARWGHSLCGSAEPIFTLAVSPGRTGAGRRQFAWVLPVGGKAAGTRTSW